MTVPELAVPVNARLVQQEVHLVVAHLVAHVSQHEAQLGPADPTLTSCCDQTTLMKVSSEDARVN